MSLNECSALHCYICMEWALHPRMCPECSKVACQNCLRQWSLSSKSQCPHCRTPLPLSAFANCQLFVSKVRALLRMDSKPKSQCKEHLLPLDYFCTECCVAVCADCSFFAPSHLNHPMTHLKKEYEIHKNKVESAIGLYTSRIDQFKSTEAYMRRMFERLSAEMTNQKVHLERYSEELYAQLQNQYTVKRQFIEHILDDNAQKIQRHQLFKNSILEQVQEASESALITRSSKYIEEINELIPEEESSAPMQIELETLEEIRPKYSTFAFIMKDAVGTEMPVVYSPPHSQLGQEWRLKVYPRGSGLAKNTHLSVFVQLTTALKSGNEYEYRIELLNEEEEGSVCREYTSTFDIGESWGYNKYIQLCLLDRGFLKQHALHFRVAVRNKTYKSLAEDQQMYIRHLQNKMNERPTLARIRHLENQSSELKSDFKKILAEQTVEEAVNEGNNICKSVKEHGLHFQ